MKHSAFQLIGMALILCLSINRISFAQEYFQFQNSWDSSSLNSVMEPAPICGANDDTLMINGAVYNKRDLHLKSPTKAFLLAVGPGFFIRGAGHFYAGKYRTASYIFLISAASLYGFSVMDSIGEYPDPASLALVSVSMLVFIGSWMYDWMIAPAIIDRENQKIIRSLRVMPFLRKHDNHSGFLGIELKYYF